jgi:NAD(P)-dependent dehydrogenase (short-subunit alcohol dehydrogenase family)
MADIVATQRRNLPLLATRETCSGGTYIVTGSNTGLGFEAAKHLVALGAAKVILAVRNVNAGEKAKASIESATGTSNVAEVWALDLSSYDSVKAFARRVDKNLDRIDALIENAAVAVSQGTLAEGHLLPVTVNVLSTLLLAVLLLPKMGEIGRRFGILPHVVIVTSRIGFQVEADWNKIKSNPLHLIDEGEGLPMNTWVLCYGMH